MDREAILQAVKEARQLAKPRNFVQSFEFIATLKEVDMRKPENRIRAEVVLPHGRGKEAKIAVVGTGDLIKQAEELGLTAIRKEEIEELGKNKRQLRKLAKAHDFFIAQADLMPLIGKYWGVILGPRGKMPKPVPANANIKPLVERLKKTVVINTRDKPYFQVLVGNEKMSDEQIVDNIEAVLDVVKKKYEKGLYHIKDAYVKLTMGPAVKIKKDSKKKR
ncbi:50S ribosomal protein L1 [Methanocaldococcus infernus]|uniref:Large ribosomal subunit protein uL1 n=1 Tax=Methanocaldococcus infernus (strain DSM 11812 / JCM 15783 / ME) TaxID=573063 RepID=D5VSW3_METIM|nr:50S ribosomal protein L1 [Methanocaldococcus infernus]ADG13666.1 ribosomal protein L1 [Methanocaldococcus infernus ME]